MVRRMRRRGGDESELVAQPARVFHDADDRPANAVERQRRSELEPQRLSDPIGDRDLVRARGVAALAEGE